MKQLITLITYVLLIITTFVIPVNSSIFSLNMANIVAPETEDRVLPPSKIVLTKLDAGDDLFRFAIDSSRSLTDFERDQLAFEANLTNYVGNTRRLTLDDFDYTVEDEGQRTTYYIKNLKQNDQYRSDDIAAEVSLFNDSITFNAYVFVPAAGLRANGKTADAVTMPLIPTYYNLADTQIDIPVYTKAIAGKNGFRQILNTLAHTPNYPGIIEKPQFPYVSYVWYSAGVLELKLLSSQLTDFTDNAAAQNALNNLLNTLKYSKGDLVVNKVSLLVDGNKTSQAFGGIDLNQDFEINREPCVYMPLIKDENMTWVPYDIKASESAFEMMKQIIEAYKNPYALSNNKIFPPMLAKTVELKNAQVVANTLKLTFNADFEKYCQANPQYCAALIEGLALSSNCMPFIENIELYIGDAKLTKIGNYQIENPISAPTYFNVDLDYLK